MIDDQEVQLDEDKALQIHAENKYEHTTSYELYK